MTPSGGLLCRALRVEAGAHSKPLTSIIGRVERGHHIGATVCDGRLELVTFLEAGQPARSEADVTCAAAWATRKVVPCGTPVLEPSPDPLIAIRRDGRESEESRSPRGR